jgi:hypothetical protein
VPYQQYLNKSASGFADFAAQRLMKTHAHVPGKFDRQRVAEDIHRHFRLIANDFAVFAKREMRLEFFFRRSIQFAVDVIRDFENDVSAVQFGFPLRK